MSDTCGCGSTEVAPTQEPMPKWWRDRALALPATSGALLVIGHIAQWSGLDITGTVLLAVGLVAGAWTFVPDALRRLVVGRGLSRLGVGLLMTIAAIGAVLLGHVGEAAALAFLFSIAEALEERAMRRAKQSLRALLTLIPETARIRSKNGGNRTIPAADVHAGEVLVIGAGERIATDGVVTEGSSWLDTSAITGESIAVEVEPGTDVAAGSVNGPGTLLVTATASGQDNSLTTIVALVEQAQANKGERARLADRIARPLVPIVLVAAFLTAAIGSLLGDPVVWIERALVVLVAASPCALAIAVPVTVISAIGAASKFGVVITSGAAFEQMGTIRTVAFDKTGTLTRNEPQVVAVHATHGHTEADVLAFAAALEATSTHPLATAVLAASHANAAREVTEVPGCGVEGVVDERQIRVGSPKWIAPRELADHAESIAHEGMSVLLVEVDGQVAGIIGVRDELRPEAPEAISTLHSQGITTVMLSGDNLRTATALATEAGIDEVHAEQLPGDKASFIRASTTPTAMVGDGINDAPALASATVGIAMGAGGSAAAVESADVSFTGKDLRMLPDALSHARRSRTIMTQNIALALAIIVLLFPLALVGVLGLAAVVLIHEVAELVVIGNGLRARKVRSSLLA